MLNLDEKASLKSSYSSIYQSLANMRELFHQTGRFDDSNAKLDEVTKLIAMYLAYRRGLIDTFPSFISNGDYIAELKTTFAKTCHLSCFTTQEGNSIFGSNPSLSFRQEDEALAIHIVLLVQTALDAAFVNKESNRPFDILNEAFGHFVRDNFRSNIEDAQYMTPPEVVDLMVNMAIHDIEKDSNSNLSETSFVMLDPTCGVGSFLTSFYHRYKSTNLCASTKIRLYGQDKVERMIRLSTINLALFDSVEHQVTIGNSLADSPLNQLNDKVDLILTNPPFGAKFYSNEIASFGMRNLPFFASLRDRQTPVDSELLFIDRNLSLLKNGGRLLIIVPDHVVSASGLPALLRQHLKGIATLNAVIELPSVTFAQAGTRTKTCVLYLTKGVYPAKTLFVAKSDCLGFEVGSRKGVQVKIARGVNDLPVILDAYTKFSKERPNCTSIIADKPSCANVELTEFINKPWTPNRYNSTKLKEINQLKQYQNVELTPLSELVKFQDITRQNESSTLDSYFISVLHIISDGILDISGIRSYCPKTPGIQIFPNEILLSKINPRIPRAIVVPDLGKKTLCSSEFAIMSPKPNVNPYAILFLLLSSSAYTQINSLTSGTSASHNRIKTNDLAQVLLPIPKAGSHYEKEFYELIDDYQKVTKSLVLQTIKMSEIHAKQRALGNSTSSLQSK